jgi:hypothetical protein
MSVAASSVARPIFIAIASRAGYLPEYTLAAYW